MMSMKFTSISQAVSTDIQQFSCNIQQIQQCVVKIGMPEDSDQVRTELHRLSHITEELAQQITEQLKELGQLVNTSGATDQRDRRTQAERLRDQFLTALTKFQQQQHEIIQRDKNVRSNSRHQHDLPADSNGLPAPTQPGHTIGVPTTAVVEIDGMQPGQLAQCESTIHKLTRLETEAGDMRKIFEDLTILLKQEQEATVVDTIEALIVTAPTSRHEGNAQLAQAANYATAARKKKLIWVLILLAVVFTTVLGVTIGLAVGFTDLL